MATVIREYVPEHRERSDNGLGFLLGLAVLLVLGVLLIYYGIPALRSSGTTINVPKSIDINLHQSK